MVVAHLIIASMPAQGNDRVWMPGCTVRSVVWYTTENELDVKVKERRIFEIIDVEGAEFE
jgi:hypothetical protein